MPDVAAARLRDIRCFAVDFAAAMLQRLTIFARRYYVWYYPMSIFYYDVLYLRCHTFSRLLAARHAEASLMMPCCCCVIHICWRRALVAFDDMLIPLPALFFWARLHDKSAKDGADPSYAQLILYYWEQSSDVARWYTLRCWRVDARYYSKPMSAIHEACEARYNAMILY